MTETAFERVITALERADSKVRWNGGQKAQAQCPHHEDRTRIGWPNWSTPSAP